MLERVGVGARGGVKRRSWFAQAPVPLPVSETMMILWRWFGMRTESHQLRYFDHLRNGITLDYPPFTYQRDNYL